jgi:hypothetical protein
MAHTVARPTDYGVWVMIAGSAAGFCLSVVNYFWPGNGIDHTPGALLVVISCALVLGASLLMALGPSKGPALRIFLDVSTCLGVIGTALAAYFLEAYVLVAFMALGLIGWLAHMISGPPAASRPRLAQVHPGAVR